jgi:hypothetical protein
MLELRQFEQGVRLSHRICARLDQIMHVVSFSLPFGVDIDHTCISNIMLTFFALFFLDRMYAPDVYARGVVCGAHTARRTKALGASRPS